MFVTFARMLAGCFKVGRVEFETVAGMITAEKAPEIGSKEAVCNCGVSNHHLAMLGVVNVIKKNIPTHGERSVGIIRRKDDETEETEVNVQLFRERIDGFEKVRLKLQTGLFNQRQIRSTSRVFGDSHNNNDNDDNKYAPRSTE
jgi:hypothetical protein